MKKGFTLAELIGVIVILAALILIIIPVVERSIREGREKLYSDQINSIKLSLESWTREYQKPQDGEVITLTLSQLKESGLIDINIKNPKTKELFPNDTVLKIQNSNGVINYDVIFEGATNTTQYESIPKIALIGSTLVYVEVDVDRISSYIDEGIDNKNNSSLELVTTTDPNFDIAKKGLYLRKYKALSEGYENVIYRTIVVRDTKGPEINFSGSLTVPLSSLSTYNFLSGVTTHDNSGEPVNIIVEKNFSVIVGTYSIKYIATDTSGNVTARVRTVNVIN